LVLLDINLEGDKTGFNLGELLYKKYKIPFIYVTQYDDDESFYKGLNTQHEDYVVKTKPHLDQKELLRKIQTVLNRNTTKSPIADKIGIIGLTKPLQQIREESKADEITKVPIPFKEITYFTTFLNEQGFGTNIVPVNYVAFLTLKKECYFVKTSLSEIQSKLPNYFTRINDKTIVNLSPEVFNGRINGSRIAIHGETHTISPRYKNTALKIISTIYEV